VPLSRRAGTPSNLMWQPFGHNKHGPIFFLGGGSAPFLGRRAGSPSNAVWSGQRPTCVPSFILIRPTHQHHRQDTQRSDSNSIGRTVLQTVAQKSRLRRFFVRWSQLCRKTLALVKLGSYLSFSHGFLERAAMLALQSLY